MTGHFYADPRLSTDVAKLCMETFHSEGIKVVTSYHITLAKFTDLIQEHVFQVCNLGATPRFAR